MSGQQLGTLLHTVFETAGYAVGFALLRRSRKRQGDFLDDANRWGLIAAAILGALVGSKVLHHLANPALWPTYAEHPAMLLSGKTVVGALLGGWAAVEVTKWFLGVEQRTGDLYVLPLICGMAIGRIGCFLAGLQDDTYGVPTTLPWGVDYGDGIPRHPTQLYEIAFLALLAGALFRKGAAPAQGDRFRGFILGYLAFRLLVDHLKPYDRAMGLNAIQWSCLLVLFLCINEWPRLAKTFLWRRPA